MHAAFVVSVFFPSDYHGQYNIFQNRFLITAISFSLNVSAAASQLEHKVEHDCPLIQIVTCAGSASPE